VVQGEKVGRYVVDKIQTYTRQSTTAAVQDK